MSWQPPQGNAPQDAPGPDNLPQGNAPRDDPQGPGPWRPGGEPGPGWLSPRVSVAGLGPRLLAWLIDDFIVLIGTLTIAIGSIVAGAWSIDPRWSAQADSNPNVMPNVPFLDWDPNRMAIVAFVAAAMVIAYVTVCWSAWSCLPGQRGLRLRVVDRRTGGKLGPIRAFVRAVALYGPSSIANVGVTLLVFQVYATLPSNNLQLSVLADYTIPTNSPLAPWRGVIDAASELSLFWSIGLLVATMTNTWRRGLHDWAAGSVVVSMARAPYRPWAGAGTAQWPDSRPTGSEPLPPRPAGTAAWHPDGPTNAEPEEGSDGTGEGPFWRRVETDSELPRKRASVPLSRRTSAYLFDCAAVFLLFEVLAYAAAAVSGADPESERFAILAGLGGGLLQILYFVPTWAFWRGSPGQKAMGIEVVNSDTGEALSLMDAFVRWAVLQGPMALVAIVPLAVTPPILFLAAAWMVFLYRSTQVDPNLRGLHDRFVGSRVIGAP